MVRKVVKTRILHLCEICEKEIPVGEECLFYAERQPKFGDDFEVQTGIEYYAGYYHLECVQNNVADVDVM